MLQPQKSLGLRLVAQSPKLFVVEMKISMNTDFPLFQTALAGIKKSSELWSETTNSTELGYEYDDTRDRAWISKLDIEKSCIKHYIQFVLISFCGKTGARMVSQKKKAAKIANPKAQQLLRVCRSVIFASLYVVKCLCGVSKYLRNENY